MNNNSKFLTIILFSFSICTLVSDNAAATGYIGDLITKALPDGQKLELIQPYGYEDSVGRQWGVPKGTVVDGASIPPVFWSLIGGPFSGKYRNASVIHDYYCDTKHRDWPAVHNLFYEAMITSGVSASMAIIMYYAVYRFGPRWDVIPWQPECPPGLHCIMAAGVGLEFKEDSLPYIQADMEEFQQFVNKESPSIEDTKAFANKQIERHEADPGKNSIDSEAVLKVKRKFYHSYEDFPEDYDSLLSDRDLNKVRQWREKNQHHH